MHVIALWNQERRYSGKWNTLYPDNVCSSNADIHCGDTFRLKREHQEPYLPAGHPGCPETTNGYPGYPSGITPAVKTNIPWSINLVRGFCSFLEKEGFWGLHLGPYWNREYFGFSFWDMNPTNPSTTGAELRSRWSGELFPHLYAKP